MCNKFSMNVNFLDMTVQINFCEGSILIWSFSLHVSFILHVSSLPLTEILYTMMEVLIYNS